MTTTLEYAALAANIYNDQRGGGGNAIDRNNLLVVPSEWLKLQENNGFPAQTDYDENFFSFTAGAYVNQGTGEIVISYKGTDLLLELAQRAWNSVGDIVSDLAAGVGGYLSTPQLTQAATYYQEVKKWAATNGYDASKISFTGHSLGGGIASVMSVWFNKPATTFAEAPFEASAYSTGILTIVGAKLALNDFVDSDFNAYAPTAALESASPVFLARQALVTNYYNQGEFLNYLRLGTATIFNTNNAIDIGNQPLDQAMALHSMNLHAAFLYDDRLRELAKTMPEVLPMLLDTKLYAADPNSSTKDFVTTLVNDHLRQRFGAPSSMLTHFATDLQKLGTNIAGLNKSAQDAIIAQGIEWYYWQGTDYAGKEFFVDNETYPSLLQYTTALGDGLEGAKNKASDYIRNWLNAAYTVSTGDTRFALMGTTFDQWSVATGSTEATATARDVAKSQIFIGGAGADTFTGGDITDVIMAGGGDDILNGGKSYDLLYGGAGTDRYDFNKSFGGDIVRDADGLGSLWVDGIKLKGGNLLKADLPNVWESADNKYRYSVMGGNLLIGRGSLAGTAMDGTITVQGWAAGGLGITLEDAPVVNPDPGALFFNGDQRAPLAGGNYDWAATSWATDGTLNNGVSAYNFSDVINASVAGSNGSVMHGWDGNDALSGSSGKDDIFGGAGSDNIRRGDGNDYINSSATLNVAQRLKPSDSWSPPGGQVVLTQGPGWGIYKDTLNGEPITYWSGSNSPSGNESDVVDAGAGNDCVIASGGDDRVALINGDAVGNDVMNGGATVDSTDKVIRQIALRVCVTRATGRFNQISQAANSTNWRAAA